MADPVSWLVISAVVSTGVSYLFPSEGPRMADLRISASTYGSIISEVYGTCRVGGNMIWSNPIRERKKKKSGKGGSYYNEYTYFCDFAMAFTKGKISNFRRLWCDGKLVYDSTGASEAYSNGQYRFRTYLGGEDQLPDSLIQASKGEDNTPAYRGLAYIVFENLPLKDFGNRLPQMAAEVFAPADGSSGGWEGMVHPIEFFPDNTLSLSAPDESVIDHNAGLVYAKGLDTSGNLSYIRVIDVATATEVRQELTMFGQPYPPTAFWQPKLNRIMAVAPNGNLLVSYGTGNYRPVAMIEPVGFKQVDAVGVSSSFAIPDFTSIPAPSPCHPAGACTTNDYYQLTSYGLGASEVWRMPLIELGKAKKVATLTTGYPEAIATTPEGEVYIAARADFGTMGTNPLTLYKLGFDELVPLQTFTPAAMGLSGPANTLFTFNALVIDESSPGAILFFTYGTKKYMSKYSLDEDRIAWTTLVKAGLSGIGTGRLRSGEYCWTDGTQLYSINTDNGEFIDRDVDSYSDYDDDPKFNPDDGADGIPLDKPKGITPAIQFYDSLRQKIVALGHFNAVISVGNALGEGVPLSSIVAAILSKTNLLPKDYDLTALMTTMVRGYGWASATDVKSIIEELKRLYLFDLVESDGRLVARMRGDGTVNSVNYTIPQDVLGSTSAEAMDYWQETRLSEADIPERVSLAYMNIDDDFETSTASSIRISNPIPTMFSRQQMAMQVNLVATPKEAKDIVHRILYSQWLERTKHTTRLPWAYLDLDPSDTVKVLMNDGRSYYDRIHSIELGANFNIEVEAYGQDSGAYESNTAADGGGAGRSPPITLAKPAKAFVFNTPLLRDTDDTGGGYSRYYTAVGQTTKGGFTGATLFRSVNGIDFDDLYAENAELEWGTVAAFPPPPYGYEALDWDTRITVTPAVSWFDLSPITDDELWAGANMVLIGNEAIQFRDCVKNADGSWTLWNLLRGRRGTEYACDTHVAGEVFAFLDSTTIEPQGEVNTARGQSRVFRAVGVGRSLNDAPSTSLLYEPRDLMPYAPGNIRRSIDDVTDDITVAWDRRTRLGGNMQDETGEVALAETSEVYEAYLLNAPFDGDLSRGAAPAPAQIVRRLDTTAPTFVYTAAMQAEDGHVTNLDPLHLVIYQISGAVGRGFPGVRTITADRDF